MKKMIRGIITLFIVFVAIGVSVWYTEVAGQKMKDGKMDVKPPDVKPQFNVPSFSKCEVCRNMRVPRKNNIMNFLYIGQGTCMQYWLAGQRARLQTHMCSVIQYYSFHTCGCEINEPNPVLEALAVKLLQPQKQINKSLQRQSNFSMFICEPNNTLLDVVVADAMDLKGQC
jgi:hypothetical protein